MLYSTVLGSPSSCLQHAAPNQRRPPQRRSLGIWDGLALMDLRSTWRFMGSYTSPNMGYNHSYPTYNPTHN